MRVHSKYLFSLVLVSTAIVPTTYAAESCQSVFEKVDAVKSKEAESMAKKLQGDDNVLPTPPPNNPNEIARLAESAWASDKIQDKVAHIKRVQSWLTYSFPGREKEVTRLMAVIKTIILSPWEVKKPPVIDLLGFPGDGKTHVVTLLAEYLGLKNRFQQVNVAEGQVDIPLSTFRILSDVAANGKTPPISLLLIDEVQKFKKIKTPTPEEAIKMAEVMQAQLAQRSGGRFRDEAPQYTSPLPMPVIPGMNDEVTPQNRVDRQKFIRILYDIYGSGNEKAPPSVSLSDYSANIKQYADHITSYRERVEASKKRILSWERQIVEKPDSAATYNESIIGEQNSIKDYERNLLSYERAAKKFILGMLKEYSEVLGTYREMTAEQILADALNNPDAFFTLLEQIGEDTVQFQRLFKYRQLVTVITGNPEKAINKVRQRTQGMKLDANQFADFARQIDIAEVRKELFEDIFGSDTAGLRQRLNVDQWQLMEVFDHATWTRFVNRQIEIQQSRYAQNLADNKIPGVTLTIDSSIRDLFLADAVVPTQGARIYFDRAIQLYGDFMGDITTRLTETPEANRPHELSWSFDPAKREFIMVGKLNGQVIFEKRAKVSTLASEAGPVKAQIESYDRIRLLTQKAGQIVMGLATFKSPPTSFRVDIAEPDMSVAGMWEAPTKRRYSTTTDYIRMALGANVAQNYLRDGIVLLNDPALKFAHEMVRHLVNDLRIREAQYAFLVDRNEKGQKIYAENFPVPVSVSHEVLEALKEAANVSSTDSAAEAVAFGKVLRIMIRDIQYTLNQNPQLLRNVAVLLDQRLTDFERGRTNSPTVTTNDILSLVEKNKIYQKKETMVSKFVGWFKKNKDPEQVGLITPETLSSHSGQISIQDALFLAPHREPGRDGLWKRLYRRMFNKPHEQRPLRPM